MITFKRDGTKIIASIEFPRTKVEARWLEFSWHTNCDITADVGAQLLEEGLKDKLKKIREEAYNQGWRDAKAKVKKEEWFSGWW